MAVGPYEKWATQLRLSWLKGEKGKAILGAWARTLGDISAAWALRGLQQQFPQLADVTALPLHGSPSGLPQGPGESDADYALRLTYAVPLRRLTGTWIGLLLALHFEGFTGLVLVQQNGRAVELDDPAAIDLAELDLTDADVIDSLQLITALGGHPGIDDHPWWTFDDDREYCSRFAILAPDGVSTFARVGIATFTGTEDGSVDNPWPVATFSSGFDDATYHAIAGLPRTDEGPMSVFTIDSSRTTTTIQVGASGPFVGTVPVLAWPVGENPFANMSASDLQRMRRIVEDWPPEKARCMGLHVLVHGEYWDWPVGTWDEPGGVWGGEVVTFDMES